MHTYNNFNCNLFKKFFLLSNNYASPDIIVKQKAEYFEKRYKGLSPEQHAELEAFDKETEELWLEQAEESIKENIPKAMHLKFKHIAFGI